MEQSSNVLKFGDWEGQQDVPYTVYFEKAGKRKSGDKLKPNDTQYKPNMPHDYTPPVQAPPFQKEVKMKASKDMEPTGSKYEHHTEAGKVWRSEDPSLPHLGWKTAVASPQQYHVGARSGSSKPKVEATMGADASRRKYELDLSRQGVELRRPTDSPSRHENVGHRAAVDLNIQRNGGVNTGDKRSMHQITGSNNHRLHQITGSNNHSIDRSPLHPRYQAMVGGISSGVSSPSWEKQVSSESRHGLSPSNQRSHLGSVTQDSRKVRQHEDSSNAVPKFGDWDEKNPSSADGYTYIFNKVREERQSTVEGTVAPAMVTEPSNPTDRQKQQEKDHAKKCVCFPWVRK